MFQEIVLICVEVKVFNDERWQLKNEVCKMEEVKIPRWLKHNPGDFFIVVGYCNASKYGSFACVYLFRQDKFGKGSQMLIRAKSKVSPYKQNFRAVTNQELTISNRELLAAELLVTLVDEVVKALVKHNVRIACFSDSNILLHWLCGDVENLDEFKRTKVVKITKIVPSDKWYYCPTAVNPAVLGTREIMPSQIINNRLWWNRNPAVGKILKDKIMKNLYQPHLRKENSLIKAMRNEVKDNLKKDFIPKNNVIFVFILRGELRHEINLTNLREWINVINQGPELFLDVPVMNDLSKEEESSGSEEEDELIEVDVPIEERIIREESSGEEQENSSILDLPSEYESSDEEEVKCYGNEITNASMTNLTEQANDSDSSLDDELKPSTSKKIKYKINEETFKMKPQFKLISDYEMQPSTSTATRNEAHNERTKDQKTSTEASERVTESSSFLFSAVERSTDEMSDGDDSSTEINTAFIKNLQSFKELQKLICAGSDTEEEETLFFNNMMADENEDTTQEDENENEAGNTKEEKKGEKSSPKNE